MNADPHPSAEQRYALSLEAAVAHYGRGYYAGRAPVLAGRMFVPAIVVRGHGLFYPGDVVVACFNNGSGTRCVVAGWSSKKRRGIPGVRSDSPLYMQYARYTPGEPKWSDAVAVHHYRAHEEVPMKQHFDCAPIRIIELPGELATLPLADPGVRAFAFEALRAAYPAAQVGTSSLGTSSSTR